jgi:hypothetical protein
MCRASGRQQGIAPRYFPGVGGEVLIPGSEEIAIKGIINTRSLKEFRDPVVNSR